MTLRFALRRLLRTPLFTVVAVLTLAVGIGATSAIFSVVHAVLIEPLPYAHPESLIDVTHRAPGANFPDAGSAPFLYFIYRDRSQTLESVGLFTWVRHTVTGLGAPEDATALNVTADVLPMLGVRPALGRWFSTADDQPSSDPTMVISDGWWRARFGGDPSAVGRRVNVDGVSREVIGVMPAGFRLIDRDASIILPLQLDPAAAVLGQFDYRSVARLRAGVTRDQVNRDLERLIPQAFASFPLPPGFTLREFEALKLAPDVRPLAADVVGDVGRTLWVLMGTISIVLLVACANVANLLLVRAEGRQMEFAVRSALGARRRELAADLLAESLWLGLAGGAAGLALASGLIRALIAIAPGRLPRLHDIVVSPLVVIVTFALAIAAAAIFGALPAMRAGSRPSADSLRSGARSIGPGRERRVVRSSLVVVQIAAAFVLLVGAGLMVRTFASLHRVEPGFDPQHALTVRVAIPESVVADPAAAIQTEHDILDRLKTIAGVTSTAATSVLPMDAGASELVYTRDQPVRGLPPLRKIMFVSPGIVDALGASLAAGREFTWAETTAKQPVAMISENLARELWRDPQAAIGKEIREDLKGPWRTIVGVLADMRDDGLQTKAPTVAYYPLLMADFEGHAVLARRNASYVIRTDRAGSQGLLTDVQRAVTAANASLPVANVRTLQDIYDGSLSRTSFALVMLGIAGAMALLIGLVGLYGAMSYLVSQRTREIGIRLALGAPRARVAALFLAQGCLLAVTGVAIGAAIAMPAARTLGSMLAGLTTVDALTYAVVSVLLLITAAAASVLPALRASGIDPVRVLRAG